LCNAAASTSDNAIQLANISMGDPNKRPADRVKGAIPPLRDGAATVAGLARKATTPAAKAKIQEMSNDLNAMAEALQGQVPLVQAGMPMNTKAADLSGHQLLKDVKDLGGICWS
jgi:hypothetical protein